MWLTRTAILRPVTITMVVVAIMVLGLSALARMGVDLYPNIDFPFVSITTVYPGAGPEEIETKVTKPIEDNVSLISGIKTVTSTSQDGISSVLLEFQLGTDLDAAVADVRSKLDAIRNELPQEVEAPVITKADISGIPVINFGLASPRPSKELRDIADNIISQRLAQVPGVAAVSVAGGDIREIEVAVDKGRLEAYGLTIAQVNQALVGENLNIPSGSITEGKKEYSVRAIGEFRNLDDIRNVRLQNSSRSPIWLRDIANVSDATADREVITRLNGKDSVTLAILKQSGANSVAVADGVKRELQALTGQPLTREAEAQGITTRAQGILPGDITVEVGLDQSTNILDTIAEVRASLIIGALLAVAIVFLFLHNVRGTFIVAIAIPTSIVATFVPIYFAGFTLNMMVLLALSLSVGILVDDSIVVLENIWRRLRLGEQPQEAAINGRTEIGLAAMTITLVDVVVFVPIAFMGGIVGQFFRQFGITVATATLFSLFISFTLTPMLASRWFRRADAVALEEGSEAKAQGRVGRFFAVFDRLYSALDRRYREILEWALDHRAAAIFSGIIVLLGCLGAAGGGISGLFAALAQASGPREVLLAILQASIILVLVLLVAGLGYRFSRGSGRKAILAATALSLLVIFFSQRSLGFEMFPRTDTGNFSLSVEMPPGTSLEATSEVARGIERYLLDKQRFPEVKNVFATVGSTAGGLISLTGRDPTLANIDVVLVERKHRQRSDLEVMNQLTSWAQTVPGPRVKSLLASSLGGPAESPIQVVLSGENIDQLVNGGYRVANLLRQMEGAKDVDISWRVGRPELQARVDRVALAERGLTTLAVANALRTSVEGSTDTKFRQAGKEYDIRVRLAQPDRAMVSQIGRIAVAGGAGQTRLEDVAQLQIAASPNKIDRRNRTRTVTVTSDLQPGYYEGNMTPKVLKAVNDMHLSGVSTYLAGETESREESFANINAALGLSIILVYILMAALFEGYLSPFIIMFSLPMALVGALLALVVTGASLSIIAMIGIIMLMGLVTKNAILLVDYTNTLRARGQDRRAAILQAGPTRLRPILMTTLAMIFGMLPTAAPGVFRLVSGAEWRAPMAAAVIGGLIVSTLLTLLIIPVLYTVFDDIGSAFTARVRAVFRRVFP